MSPLMRDIGKSRKPLQRGRISTEPIQAVQELKRSKGDEVSLQSVLGSKVGRLMKTDLMAVLHELHRQDESLLVLQVLKGVRSEYWYKPKVSLYAEMVRTLALNEQSDEVSLVVSWLKWEMHLEAGDVEGFNSLLAALVEFDYVQSAMECFHLMKVMGCELQETIFRILVSAFDAKNLMELSEMIRQEAQDYLGEHINHYSMKKWSVWIAPVVDHFIRSGIQKPGNVNASTLRSILFGQELLRCRLFSFLTSDTPCVVTLV